jgi:hypothetical protein
MIEELLQRALRQGPQWMWRILPLSALVGFTLKCSIELFRPLIEPYLVNIIDPSSLNVTTLSFASLLFIAPVWVIWHYFDSDRPRVRAVLDEIEIVEAAMERVTLREQERVTVRRAIIKALADAAKRSISASSATVDMKSAVDIKSAVNSEVPELIE